MHTSNMLEIRARRFLSTMMLTMPHRRWSGSNHRPTQDFFKIPPFILEPIFFDVELTCAS